MRFTAKHRSTLAFVCSVVVFIGCSKQSDNPPASSSSRATTDEIKQKLKTYMIEKFKQGIIGCSHNGQRWSVTSADVKQSDSLLVSSDCPLEGVVYLTDRISETDPTPGVQVFRRAYLVPKLKDWQGGDFSKCVWQLDKLENQDNQTREWFDASIKPDYKSTLSSCESSLSNPSGGRKSAFR